MDGDVLSGEHHRQSALLRVRPVSAAGLSLSGWAVRKLDSSARGTVRGATGIARAGDSTDRAWCGQQSLYPDWTDAADRSVGEERHPDCRSGARATDGRRVVHFGIGGGGVTDQVPADPDDLFRIYPGRAAAGAGD